MSIKSIYHSSKCLNSIYVPKTRWRDISYLTKRWEANTNSGGGGGIEIDCRDRQKIPNALWFASARIQLLTFSTDPEEWRSEEWYLRAERYF